MKLTNATIVKIKNEGRAQRDQSRYVVASVLAEDEELFCQMVFGEKSVRLPDRSSDWNGASLECDVVPDIQSFGGKNSIALRLLAGRPVLVDGKDVAVGARSNGHTASPAKEDDFS